MYHVSILIKKAIRIALLLVIWLSCINIPSYGQLVLNQPNTAGTFTAPSSILLSNGFSTAPGQTAHFSINTGCVPLSASPSQSQNYILTTVPRVPIYDASQIPTKGTCEVMQSIQYFDGLGRPVQRVQVKASPTYKDVIQPVVYDNQGREVKKYLPYTTDAGAVGSFRTDAIVAQSAFYQSPAAGVVQIPTGQVPYAETRFETSPLNRPLEQGAPGLSWQIGGGHTVAMGYDINTSADAVKLWLLNIGTGLGAATNANYPAGTLVKSLSTDENGHQTIEYKDKAGKMIRRSVQYNGATFIHTDYIYDDLGALRYVIPPLPSGVAYPSSFTENENVFKSFFYGYHYDYRMRQVEKKVPGKGWEYTVYNNADQAILTQDANQRSKGLWLFAKFDVHGRGVINGQFSSSATRDVLQAAVNSFTGPLYETFNNGSTNFGYTQAAYPDAGQSGVKALSVIYFDNYSFVSNGTINPNSGVFTTPNIAIDTIYQAPRGQAVGTLTNVLGTTDYLLTSTFYDKDGHPVKIITQNYQGGSVNAAKYDVEESQYSFNGLLTRTERKHYLPASASAQVTLTTWQSYDHMNRSVQVRKSFNGASAVILSQMEYNELGQLKIKHLHSTAVTTALAAETSFLQHIDYRYNSRGWLTRINNPGNLTDENGYTTATEDVFAEQLDYDQNTTALGAAAAYNGNISSVKWQTKVPSVLSLTQEFKGFTYTYDAVNRLTLAASIAQHTGNGQHNEQIAYDELGNITSLTRKNGPGTNLNALTYNYTESGVRSNKLAAVTDSGTEGYSSQYSYDDNGSVIADTKKGITNIEYNILNLPAVIHKGTKTLTYIYNASGQKLQRIITQNSTLQESRSYIDGIEYTGNSIEFISTEEGRALPISSNYAFEYNLPDHLGNVRAVFGDKNNNGALSADEIVQTTDYYAFGRQITYSQGQVPNPNNAYKYNGKELQEDLGQYDYGARFYDPVIARWHVIDPLADQFIMTSPYKYAGNNPINMIDPDGRAEGYGFADNTTGGIDHMYSASIDFDYKYNGKTYHGAKAFMAAEPYAAEGYFAAMELYDKVMNGETGGGGGGSNVPQPKTKTNPGFNLPKIVFPPITASPWSLALSSSGTLIADDATGIGAADDVAIPVILGVAAALDIKYRTYVTYTLTNPTTGQIYVGRTSGFGDPNSIMMRRYLGHHMRAFGFGNPQLDQKAQGWPLGLDAIRGREQQLIDFYGGVGSSKVGNRIRGVGYYRPDGRYFHALSNSLFGPLAKYTGFF